MNRIIRTVAAAAALTLTAAGTPTTAAAFDFGGPVPVPPPGGWQIMCGTADLAATITDTFNYGSGWVYVTVEVTNDGSVDFEANPGQAGVMLTVGGQSTFVYGDIMDVPVNTSTTRGGWIRLPGYAAPDGEPEFGQCPTDGTITARVSYDPDLGLDGDPAHRDCDFANNVDRLTLPYLVHCPW